MFVLAWLVKKIKIKILFGIEEVLVSTMMIAMDKKQLKSLKVISYIQKIGKLKENP